MASPVLHIIIEVVGQRYALNASDVLEIIPLVRLRTLAGAPPGTAGLMTFRGVPVPVVDLSLIACGRATPETGAARIVVLDHAPAARPGARQPLGLLVPSARDVVRLDPDAFVDGGLVADGVPALGRVLASPEGMLQRVHAAALLTPQLRDALQRAADTAA